MPEPPRRASRSSWSAWVFGRVRFADQEEYDEFRYKFLIVLMLTAAGCTALFILGEYLRLNRIETPHFLSMHLFTAGTLVLWL